MKIVRNQRVLRKWTACSDLHFKDLSGDTERELGVCGSDGERGIKSMKLIKWVLK